MMLTRYPKELSTNNCQRRKYNDCAKIFVSKRTPDSLLTEYLACSWGQVRVICLFNSAPPVAGGVFPTAPADLCRSTNKQYSSNIVGRNHRRVSWRLGLMSNVQPAVRGRVRADS